MKNLVDRTGLRGHDFRPLYMLPTDPLADEVLIPAFSAADSVDCMVGFFSSEVFGSLAPGLATFVARSNRPFRLIVSPLLRDEDRSAIERGLVEQVAETVMDRLIITEDILEQHTLKCLSWLLREGRVVIRVALMSDALFHPKVWIFESQGDRVAVHGSSNVTLAGIRKNIEQVSTSQSWLDPTQLSVTKRFRDQFDRLWADQDPNCIVVDMPEAIRHRLVRVYSAVAPPTEDDLRSLYRRATDIQERRASDLELTGQQVFTIPSWLKYEDGPFAHQGKAVTAWCEAGYRGVLEMATGSGKTITSMIAAHRLHKARKPLLIVVAAPFVPLIEQWCGEIASFGLNASNLAAMTGAKQRGKELQRIRRHLELGLSKCVAVVVTHDTLCTPRFQATIEAFRCQRLLIADEVHNLGRRGFIEQPPVFFDHRLGLSATPVRQYDESGTEALFEFFGPVVFRYTLREAIGNCLVEYDYYVHPVRLTQSEMDDWREITGKIKQNAWRSEDGKPDDYLKKLFRDRRALLETASGKIDAVATLLDREDPARIRHTLIYASDKGPIQLDTVNRLLHERGIRFHQLTAAETRNRHETAGIIRSFQDGDIHVLTAKRVLDEGVNIPQIQRAFVLASTTVERQWIQRRGRLLRKSTATGKTHSVIHDLLALPAVDDHAADPDTRSLLRGELTRVQAFARLARNAGSPDGPLPMIDEMVDLAFT